MTQNKQKSFQKKRDYSFKNKLWIKMCEKLLFLETLKLLTGAFGIMDCFH